MILAHSKLCSRRVHWSKTENNTTRRVCPHCSISLHVSRCTLSIPPKCGASALLHSTNFEDIRIPSSTPVILCYPVLSRYDALESLLYASYTIQHFIALLPDY